MTLARSDIEPGPHCRTLELAYDPSFMPDVYLEWVYGDCCGPVIRHGDGVLISKSAPIRPGDFVAILARTPRERPGLTSGFIKRFVGWQRQQSGTSVLITEMINPRRRRVFKEDEVIALHRVVTVVFVGPVASIERLENLAIQSAEARGRHLSPTVGRLAPQELHRVLPGRDQTAGNSIPEARPVTQGKPVLTMVDEVDVHAGG